MTQCIRYKKIPGYNGYLAGSDGSIWSCWYFGGRNAGWLLGHTKRRRLSAQPMQKGHLRVTLYVGGRRRQLYVHALVLLAFKGVKFAGMETRHLDGCPTNNLPSNLIWGTRLQNSGDRTRHGRVPIGEKSGKAKITTAIVLAIVRRWHAGDPVAAMMADYTISKSTVHGVLRGRVWSHVTGITKSGRMIARNPITTETSL